MLLTQDKDFGELAYRGGLPAECGVILSRIPPETPVLLASALAGALENPLDWAGHFAVIEPGRIRLRPLPVSPDQAGP